VAEAYANLTAVGAEPLALTNCLNFGNPEKPEIMWQFVESIRGLGDACRQLGTPVVSGNVSLYNETDGQAIKPTPMVAMVGLLDDCRLHGTMAFIGEGLDVAVIGPVAGRLAGSAYIERFARLSGAPAALDEGEFLATCGAVRELIRAGRVSAVHDISDGGLAVAVAECAVSGDVGVAVEISADLARGPGGGAASAEEVMFGEAPGRFVVAYRREDADAVAEVVCRHGAAITGIGRTTGGGDDRVLSYTVPGAACTVSIADARVAYRTGFTEIVR